MGRYLGERVRGASAQERGPAARAEASTIIKKVTFHRFKQFKGREFELAPRTVTLVAGGNNAGKSSILHGLAVWEFCRTVIEAERGHEAFLAGTSTKKKQGLGLGTEEFSPINVPSLNHLWTNLRTQKDREPDGYTLRIACVWDTEHGERQLEFGLALSNDRLFVRTNSTNLTDDDAIPRMAYLPPFAGITAREMRLPGAIRRRRIGEGLAGAVLRNLLLDMYDRNQEERRRARGDRHKMLDSDLRRLRDNDPWELLQAALRETFGAELDIAPFSEEYHSYIRVEVVKGAVDGFKLKRYPGFNKRDLMVEGSGFLQWLSVYTLATNPDFNVLLLDEPDAHLHASLQAEMLAALRRLAGKTGKQVLIATHSSEILRNGDPEDILEIRRDGSGRYLSEEHHKVGLLAGLGSDYAPRIDRVRRTKRLLFVEGPSDVPILQALATTLQRPWPEQWIMWCTPTGHKERKQLFRALSEEIPGLVALSLRDRDDTPLGQVGDRLEDKTVEGLESFHCRCWRRRNIEAHLLWPAAIAAATGFDEQLVRDMLAERFGLAIAGNFPKSHPPEALLHIDGKVILLKSQDPPALLQGTGVGALEVARAIPAEAVCDDIQILLDDLDRLAL
jgi:predicted ATPase